MLEVGVQLAKEDLDEVKYQVNYFLKAVNDEAEEYHELCLLSDRMTCLAYRIVGDRSGALTRYKKAAAKGAQLLRDYPGIVPSEEHINVSSPDAWTHAIYTWLRLDSVSAHCITVESLGTLDLETEEDEGLDEVEVYRHLLPDTAIRSSRMAIDCLLQLIGEPLKYGTSEWDICRVLSDGRSLTRSLIQPELVSGDSSDGDTKTTLSGLVKRQILGKRPGRKGYFLTERGKIAFAAAR